MQNTQPNDGTVCPLISKTIGITSSKIPMGNNAPRKYKKKLKFFVFGILMNFQF